MTCYDCIHTYPCKYDRFFGVGEVENKCHYFKNKADFVEVVRCKDCKHGHWYQETCHGKCVHYCDLTDLQIDKEHFCSYGERRDT